MTNNEAIRLLEEKAAFEDVIARDGQSFAGKCGRHFRGQKIAMLKMAASSVIRAAGYRQMAADLKKPA